MFGGNYHLLCLVQDFSMTLYNNANVVINVYSPIFYPYVNIVFLKVLRETNVIDRGSLVAPEYGQDIGG